MTLDPVAKILFLVGILCIAAGAAWQMGWIQNLKIGRLPGDILIERENMKFYFPITTGLLISAVVSLVLWILKRN